MSTHDLGSDIRGPGTADQSAWRQSLNEMSRTRLNAIVGFAGLLGLEPLSPTAQADLKQIQNAARDLLTVINEELGSPCMSGRSGFDARAKGGCDLLYIEDDMANVTLIKRILELRPELTMKHAGHGHLGIGIAKTDHPRLILLDLKLPDLNGTDVLQALQNSPETSSIPVVVISANVVPTQIERLLVAGAKNYLTKPFELDHFLAVVDEWTCSPAA